MFVIISAKIIPYLALDIAEVVLELVGAKLPVLNLALGLADPELYLLNVNL